MFFASGVEKLNFMCLIRAEPLENYCELHKVQPLSTDLESMDACSLNYWRSKFVQEVANAEEGKVSSKDPLRHHLRNSKAPF